ncbi:MAG: hypothetical protein K8U03_11510 [Planctomycetia bacterium]|nr:hypothetical protein [Planctomycetia bacterium]
MSAISSVGSSTPVVNQQIQAATNKQASPAASSTASQAKQPAASSDPDHDGDNHSGRLNVTA